MDSQQEILDSDYTEKSGLVEPQYLISPLKFGTLCFFSFGLYEVWWMYKSWKYFLQKDKLDIQPGWRAVFGIFFLIPLFNAILEDAKKAGYTKTYSSVALFLFFLMGSLLGRAPGLVGLLSVFSFVFLLPPFKALNFTKRNTPDITIIEQVNFNGRQIILMIFGALLWLVCIYALSLLGLRG